MNLREKFARAVTAAALVSGAAISVPAFAQVTTSAEPAKVTSVQSVASSITIDPIVPVPVILLLGGAFALAAGIGFTKRVPSTALLTGAGAVLVGALLNPLYIQERRDPVATEALIMIDRSASQNLGERTKDTEQAYAALTQELKAKGITIHTVEAGASRAGAVANGTELFGAMSEELANIQRERLGAIYMITDGQVHDVPDDLKVLGADVPVHGLITGKQNEFDRRVVIDKVSPYGVVNEETPISFHVADDGPSKGSASVLVTISIDGKEEASKMVVPGQMTEVKVKIPHVGTNVVEVKTEAVAGESFTANNTVATEIRGKRKALNILLVSGAPNSGLRMLRDMFKSDPDNTLINFTSIRNLETLDETPEELMMSTSLPMDDLFLRNIDKFDLIVFDHFSNDDILPEPYFINIAEYVKKGGSLLVLGGQEYAGPNSVYNTVLKPLLPVVPEGGMTKEAFVPKVTGQGAKHPVTRDLPVTTPWGHWYSMAGGKEPTGDVVMEGAQKKPLIVMDHKDKGRVAMIMSDQLWLWAAGHDGGGPAMELMRNTSRWLLKNPTMEEEALRLRVSKDDGQLVIEQQTMADQSSPVTIHTPSGKNLSATFTAAGPGLWRATMKADEPGLYSAEQGGKHPLKSFVNVGQANAKEFARVVSTADILKPVANATGGGVLFVRDANGQFVMPKITTLDSGSRDRPAGGDDNLGVRMTATSTLKGIDRTGVPPALNAALILAALMAAYHAQGGRKKKPAATPPGPKGPEV